MCYHKMGWLCINHWFMIFQTFQHFLNSCCAHCCMKVCTRKRTLCEYCFGATLVVCHSFVCLKLVLRDNATSIQLGLFLCIMLSLSCTKVETPFLTSATVFSWLLWLSPPFTNDKWNDLLNLAGCQQIALADKPIQPVSTKTERHV